MVQEVNKIEEEYVINHKTASTLLHVGHAKIREAKKSPLVIPCKQYPYQLCIGSIKKPPVWLPCKRGLQCQLFDLMNTYFQENSKDLARQPLGPRYTIRYSAGYSTRYSFLDYLMEYLIVYRTKNNTSDIQKRLENI